MRTFVAQIQRHRHRRWFVIALAALLLVGLLSGCGQQAAPLSQADTKSLGEQMVAIERGYADYENKTVAELAQLRTTLGFGEQAISSSDSTARAHAFFLKGYAEEFSKQYADAEASYRNAIKAGSSYTPQAQYRIGVLGMHDLLGSHDQSLKAAKEALSPFVTNDKITLLVRHPDLAGSGGTATLATGPTTDASALPTLTPAVASQVTLVMLDILYSQGGGLDSAYYRSVDIIVGVFDRILPTYGPVVALIFLALLVKLVTMPLTTMSFRGMRDMQRVQPMLKELQEKYKDDRAKLAEEQMKLMKEHKVSPLGGCLPMLIQLPIFIVVYQAVRVYSAGFAESHFLWIPNLAMPDFPLLVLYGLSMIVTQKLTAMPSTDPQQQMMQKQMTYLMPVFLVIVLNTIASAFLLYWFFLNIFSAIHQYYLMERFKAEEAVMDVKTSPAAPSAPPAPTRRSKKGKRSS